MGLVVDLREKMTSMSPSHPSIGGRSHSNNNHQHNQGEQVVRKKRTFDIAFLTGQSEQKVVANANNPGLPESNNNNGDNPSRNKRYANSSPSSVNYLASLPSEDGSPFNLTQDGTNYSSDTSSMIDVMTNGSSLSESESSPASSPRIGHTPTHPVIPKGIKGKGIGSSYNNGNKNPGRAQSTRNPVKEEIRFESKRTIDINHTSDSLKIKENLRFSTSIPSGSPGSGPSSDGSNCTGDLTLPQMTFALFPHMAKFPMGLPMGLSQNNQLCADPGMSFSTAKMMEKCEGINLSYHHHGQNHHHNNNNNHPLAISKLRGGFPDPYAHAAAAAAMAGGYPYPNLIIPHELQHRHSQFSPPGHGSSGPAGGGGNIAGGGQPSPPGMNHPGGVTLLPPSLTALTLPAQNVCAKCNIGFRMTSDLVYHMRSHHKRDTFDPLKKQREEKLKCPVCYETFRERHHLTRHMTAHQDRAEEKIDGAALAAAVASGIVSTSTSIVVKK